jgi:uncharacterized protein DUF3592
MMDILVLTAKVVQDGLPIFIGTSIAVFAVFIWRLGRRDNAMARASLDWPQAAGKIVSMSVVKTALSAHASKNERELAAAMPFDASVHYEYQVAGRTCFGSRVTFSDGNMENHSAEAAAKTAAEYPVGKMVAVHYDPADPNNSTLVAGIVGRGSNATRGGIAFMCFGVVWIGFGVKSWDIPLTAESISVLAALLAVVACCVWAIVHKVREAIRQSKREFAASRAGAA